MVWAIFAPSALALTYTQLFMFAPQLLYIYALSFAITSALSVALFYAGAFGGADAKALICISLALPTYPVYLPQPKFGFVIPLFPIATFCNAILLAAFSVFYALIRNCLWKHRTGRRLFEGFERESRWRKILTLLCGYKARVADLEKVGHLYPLEDIRMVEGESQRKLIIMPKDEERGRIVERILEAKRQGKLQNEVWVSPGLPLVIFITAGLIIALTVGDLVWIVLGFSFGWSR